MLCRRILLVVSVSCLSYWILSVNSNSTNHAGVILCCRRDSPGVPVLFEVYTTTLMNSGEMLKENL